MIVAQRSANGIPGAIVAMHLALDEGATFNLTEESTATAIVLSHPDVAYLAPQYYDVIASWLTEQPNFQTLRDQFTTDLATLGHLDLQASSIPLLRTPLIASMLSELLPNLMGGSSRAQSPWLAVDNGDPSLLYYEHDGINLGYVARTYHNGTPVSFPVLFPGDSHPDVRAMNINVKDLIGFILQMDVRFPSISTEPSLSISSVALPENFAELDVWLVNGEGPQHANERDIAERYNTFIFAHRVFTGCLPGTILGELLSEDACVRLETIDLLGTLLNGPQEPDGALIAEEVQSWSLSVLECVAPEQVLEWISPLLNLDALNEIGFMVQMIYDLHAQESELIYRNTKIGYRWEGKLVIESNVSEQFVGIPGSMTTESPAIIIKSREAHVRRPSGLELYSAIPGDVNLFDMGFTFNALMVNTETIGVPSGNTYSEQFINEIAQSGQNQFNWRLATNATPPLTAQFNVGIYHSSGEIPNYVEGYGAGGLPFTAEIENPVLVIQGTIPLHGQAEQPVTAVVQLKTESGQGVNDFPVYCEILEGGGSLGTLGQIQSTVQTEQVLFNGIAQEQWILGEEGPQRMRAFVNPSGQNVLAEVEFQAEITPIPPISLAGFTYSVVSWRFGSVPGHINCGSPCGEPADCYFGTKTVTFDESSYMMEIWNEDGTSSVGGPYPYSIGAYSADSLFMFSDGASGIGLDCTNSYGHQYPEGWGMKIPPGFTLNWGTETFDIAPSRVSLDGVQIYRLQTGDEVYIRQ